ncbi:MAG: TIGR00730 family Rossman fold protein [Propylenella sp.]
MGILKSVCVYCGSGLGTNPSHAEAARILGRAMAENGVGLVYGGGSVGLMGILARAALDAGGAVTGIIPRFLERRERLMPDLTETIVTEDMHERKMQMFERADAFAALPGGVGTLEELVEQMTWAQLGRHEKPVLLANIGGFWDPFIRLLDEMRRERYIRSEFEVSCLVAERAEDIVPMLQRAAAERPQAELEKAASAEPLSRM